MGETARRTFVATIVVVAVVAATLALRELKVLIALIFLGFVLAAAMRPGIDALARHRVPRPLGLALHYLGIAAVLALLLWLVVPPAVDQIGQAIGGVPTSKAELAQQTKHSSGLKHEILAGVQKWLDNLPSAGGLFRGAVSLGIKAFEVLVGIFFVFATAAYWIFERDRTMRLVDRPGDRADHGGSAGDRRRLDRLLAGRSGRGPGSADRSPGRGLRSDPARDGARDRPLTATRARVGDRGGTASRRLLRATGDSVRRRAGDAR